METVARLNELLESDGHINEIGFIADENTDVLLIDHKLGLSMKSLKPLMLYSICRFGSL
jgi:hypothetical protein